jgi:hypothetical protein
MESVRIIQKLNKFPLLDTSQKFILLVMYDRHISISENKSFTTSELNELNICKKSSLYSKLKKLQEMELIDLFDKKYFITPKFLYEMGKINWEELSSKKVNSVGYLKDFTVEKLQDFLDTEVILITNTMKEDLFNTLKKSSNISITLKDWFFTNYGTTEGAVYYNRFIRQNSEE